MTKKLKPRARMPKVTFKSLGPNQVSFKALNISKGCQKLYNDKI